MKKKIWSTLAILILLTGSTLSAQESLNYSDQNWSKIPASLRQKKDVTELILTGNPLEELPSWLTEFDQLEKICLDGISTLDVLASFKLLAQLPALKELSWNKGKLVFIPSCIQEFKSLTTASFTHNGISQLPPFSERMPLNSLNIAYNLIDSLPPSLGVLKQLNSLDFSFNKGIQTPYNYHLLGTMLELKDLSIQGLKEIPEEVSKLVKLEHLNLSRGRFTALPPGFSNLVELKEIHCLKTDALQFSAAIEVLSSLKHLQVLRIGGKSFEQLPYNLFKLRSLQHLEIRATCLSKMPSSVQRLNIKKLSLIDCSVSEDVNLFNQIASIKHLESLTLEQLNLSHQKWELAALVKLRELDSLNLKNNGLQQLNINPAQAKNLSVDLNGNFIATRELNLFRSAQQENSYGQSIAPKKDIQKITFKKSHSHKAFKKVIYTTIGDDFSVNGIRFYIPPNAFIDEQTTTVEDEIVISIQFFNKPEDICASGMTFFDQNNTAFNPVKTVEISAVHKTTGLPVFIDQRKKIRLSYDNKNANCYTAYELQHNNRWSVVDHLPTACPLPVSKRPTTSFRTYALTKQNSYPQPTFEVRKSKVQLRLKRNKRKGTLNFTITPEYGYKESFFQLFGDRIKAYPELKTYEGIKWLCVGDDIEEDLKKLYFLSEQANTEKLDRKSSFYFYVLNINNILITPHPIKDHYVMRIFQANDTLQLDVLPQLKLIKAKKIQKWHRKKFKKYQRKLIERQKNWKALDTAYSNYYLTFEERINSYRNQLATSFTNIAPAPINSVQPPSFSFEISRLGTFSVGEKLLIPNPERVKNIPLKISGRKHYAKYVLIKNKKHTYWQNTNELVWSKNGKNFVFSMVGKQLYYQVFEPNKILNLIKFKP